MMRLRTRLVGSSPRVLGVYQDGVREFIGRKLRLTGRLSGVAEMLVGSIGKIARNTTGDRRRKTVRLIVGNAGGCWIARVRLLIKLGVMYGCNP
ncbi:hypothetical protein BHE74_00028756 [Ensete ventricosum]|uniref:Uncharacterized protein n=1 Tax=Ensete ventricosum TaxID=4639 RepID=A0A444CHI1_ENSVE|nr:hypothetical protein GW17_00052847 [Ensete ventricosum]RWW64031.1 hypothetical protein BHE74_00028756 [Ensete ventricosum]RZR73355.1 hypothetical protein BHM03_00023139 [Ensete ventricosum]